MAEGGQEFPTILGPDANFKGELSFEKGMRLSDTCRKQLEEAETRVEMLIRKEGKIQPEPFRPEKA